MAVFSLLAVGFVMKVVGVLFVICAVALVLVVLIQKGRGGGLSAAFGGAMAGGILGSKTGDFLTWVTIVLVSVFLILAGPASAILVEVRHGGLQPGRGSRDLRNRHCRAWVRGRKAAMRMLARV
ncbi:MAG: preprotein translocase subunit SecG [Planctomycetota bacterium]|jgi:protein translocase SecG subunit